jgi:hypothetical protein
LLLCSHWLALNLGLSLVPIKCNIKNYKEGIYFLGYNIKKKYIFKVTKKHKLTYSYFNFNIPLDLLFFQFANRGFFRIIIKSFKKKFVSCYQEKWLFLKSDFEVISKYNRVISGIKNYYSCSTQQEVLYRFWFLMRESCALTIAYRNKKKLAEWAYNKYTFSLLIINKISKQSISFIFPQKTVLKWFSGQKGNLDNMLVRISGVPILPFFSITDSIFNILCSVEKCKQFSKIWYCIKQRRRFKGRLFRRQLLAYTLKKIPVCRYHYNQICSGQYDGISLQKLKGFFFNS